MQSQWNFIPFLDMSCSDLTNMRGCQVSNCSNGHQATCPTDLFVDTVWRLRYSLRKPKPRLPTNSSKEGPGWALKIWKSATQCKTILNIFGWKVCTVPPKKYSHCLWIVVVLPTFFRVTSLSLGQSYDCPSASEATLKDVGETHYLTKKKTYL